MVYKLLHRELLAFVKLKNDNYNQFIKLKLALLIQEFPLEMI